MSKRNVKNYSTIDEWDSVYFPTYVSKARLTNLGGDPAALAGILAEEALKHATAQLSSLKRQKRTAVGIHK